MSSDRVMYAIVLSTLLDGGEVRRLKAALKVLLRAHGFRCERIAPAMPPDGVATPTDGEVMP